MALNAASMPPPQNEVSEEQLRTLWVGGISDRVDEETLYELFINAGPLQSVRIPVDRDTKKQKPFAFVLFSHAESLPFAYDLFRDVKLYGRPLRMQNKETGLGMGAGSGGGRSYNRSDSDRGRRPGQQLEVTLSQHHRSVSVPENFHQGHQPVPFQQQYQQYGANLMPGMMNAQFMGGNQHQNQMLDGFMQQQMQMQQQAMMQQQFQQQNFQQPQFQQQQRNDRNDRYDREDQQRGVSRGDRALYDRDRSRSNDRGGDRRRWDSWDSHQGGGGRRDHGRSSRR